MKNLRYINQFKSLRELDKIFEWMNCNLHFKSTLIPL